jgi:hypothetical protein
VAAAEKAGLAREAVLELLRGEEFQAEVWASYGRLR